MYQTKQLPLIAEERKFYLKYLRFYLYRVGAIICQISYADRINKENHINFLIGEQDEKYMDSNFTICLCVSTCNCAKAVC